MKTLNRIVAMARESAENLDATEIDTSGDLVGADTIDKEILELNELPGTEILDDLEALDDAVEDAEEMGAIAAGLIGEDTPNEPIAAVAAETIARRITAVAGKYGVQVGGFARESHDDATAGKRLAQDAQFVREGILDVMKAAYGTVGKKIRSLLDAVAKNDEHLTKRVAQLKEKLSGMGDSAGSVSFTGKYITGASYAETLKAVAGELKKLEAVKRLAEASHSAIEKSKKDNFEDGEKKENAIIAGSSVFDGEVTLITVDGIIVDSKEDFTAKEGSKTFTEGLDKKDATATLAGAEAALSAYKALAANLGATANKLYGAVTKVNTGEYASENRNEYRRFAGNTAVLILSNAHKATTRIVNDATRYVEASIKASKAPAAKAE